VQVAVIGAGQAGLSIGHHLHQAGLAFVILDGAAELGAVWRRRWDSLQLFTPARFSALPGMPFPGDPDRYPAKDDVPQYFRRYADAFGLPVLLGHQVTGLRRDGEGFVLTTSRGTCRADQVVIATGAFQTPVVPDCAQGLDPRLPQWHSHDYRSPEQIPAGTVLVVGGGNSGAQIAEELSAARTVVLSQGTRLPRAPRRLLGRGLFWWLSGLRLMKLPVHGPVGRRLARPDPVFGTDVAALARDGRLRLVGRTVAAEGSEITTADGTRLRPDAVVWATGYRGEWGWLDPQLLDDHGNPRHTAGVGAVPGTYFLGLYRLRSRGSSLLGFVGHDAQRLSRIVIARSRRSTARPTPRMEGITP